MKIEKTIQALILASTIAILFDIVRPDVSGATNFLYLIWNLFLAWIPFVISSFFVKKTVYEKYGLFDTAFKIAADYELMLRFLYKYNISSFFLNDIIIKMRYGGRSNKSIRNITN